MNHIQSLPIYQYKNQVLEAIDQHRVTIISGETGSGKTTQVPQYLLENAKKCQNSVKIICTEPRRIAAVSVSERVAEECSTQVRFCFQSVEISLFLCIIQILREINFEDS